MPEEKKMINFLSVKIREDRTIVATSAAVAVGDVVRWRVMGRDFFGEVDAVVSTEEGSDLHHWISTVSRFSDRTVTGVWHRSDEK